MKIPDGPPVFWISQVRYQHPDNRCRIRLVGTNDSYWATFGPAYDIHIVPYTTGDAYYLAALIRHTINLLSLIPDSSNDKPTLNRHITVRCREHDTLNAISTSNLPWSVVE